MNINKAKLQEALETVKPALSSKEIIEQSTSFAFMNGRVVTYNDEISISHPVEGLEIEGAVKAELLYQLLSKLKADEIEVVMENNEIQLKAGKAKAGLIVQSEIKLPLESLSERGKWKTLPEDFIKAMSFVVTAAGTDMSRPVLTCVHVNCGSEDEPAWVEASDSHRLSKFVIESMPVGTFLIPAKSALIVIKMQPIKIAEGKGWIHFKTAEGTILSCRIYEQDAYPKTSHLYTVEGAEVTLPKDTQSVLTKAVIFAKRDHMLDELVHITLSDKVMEIKADADNGAGWFKEELSIKYKGPVIAFSISPYLLKGIISETLDCIISSARMKFQGEGWVYVSQLEIPKAITKAPKK